MTRLPTIWACIKEKMPRGVWIDIEDIYNLIKNNISLDDEDFEWQSPTSDIPKWKRNVRNVLQYRKSRKKIQWNGDRKYRI